MEGQPIEPEDPVPSEPTPAPEPAPEPEPESQPEEPQEEPMAENGGGALAAEAAHAKQLDEEREAAEQEKSEQVAAASQVQRELYEASDAKAVADQIVESEAAMRGPNHLIGNPGDPTKGPSS